MEGLIFVFILIIGAFLFSLIGVIYLLAKTGRQEESIREIRLRLDELGAINRAPLLPAAAEPVSPKITPDILTGVMSDTGLAPDANLVPDASLAPDTVIAPCIAPDTNIAPDTSLAPDADMQPSYGSQSDEIIDKVLPGFPAENAGPKNQKRFQNTFLLFVKSGNLWAAGGVILLTAGFGMLIAYLGRRGFFTVEMGIAAAAAAGLIMILLGWRLRRKRPMYFLILQGGGIGILYLSIFASYKFTPHLGPIPCLILMSILIPPAIILALFQNSQGLAIFGFLGGFAAPLLLSSGGGNHLFLFSYYLVLNAGVLAIGFFRSWKGLNLLAFLLTFIPSIYWAMTKYTQAFFASSEPFFIAYIILFTVMGLESLKTKNIRLKPARTSNYSDTILIIGTPAAAAALQWKIFSFYEHGFAIIAIIFSAFYLVLTIIILKKGNVAMRSYAEGYLALGTLLANLVIPLELSPGLSGSLWAAEGALVFFLGLRAVSRNWKGEPLSTSSQSDHLQAGKSRGDPRIITAGIAIHIASAIAFVRDISLTNYKRQFTFMMEPSSWRSPAFTGALIIAVSALSMAIMAEKLSPGKKEKQKILPLSALLWGLAFWFGGWYYEFRRILPSPSDAFLILASATALVSWLAASVFALRFLLAAMIPASLAGFFSVIGVFSSGIYDYFYYGIKPVIAHDFFDSFNRRGWIAFFLAQGLTIFLLRPAPSLPDSGLKSPTGKKLRTAEPEWFREIRIFLAILTTLGVLSAWGRYITSEIGLSVSWTSLAGLFPLFLALIIFPFCSKNAVPWKKLLKPVLPLILSGILGLWFTVTLFLPGDPSPLPFYVPVLNPLDLLEGLCIASILFWQFKAYTGAAPEGKMPFPGRAGLIVIGDILVFFWITAILARNVHYFSPIYWRMVGASSIFQLCLFVFWALYGILHIILGHRAKKRIPWIAGAVLVSVDIAKLILLDMKDFGAIPRILSFFTAGLVLLFIGWAAPLPPSVTGQIQEKKTINKEEGAK